MPGTVLLLAPHFPPIGGPAAQRNLNLAARLPDFGWRPVVLTAANGSSFWAPVDAELEKRVSPGLTVIRLDIQANHSRVARLERLLALPGGFGRAFTELAVPAVRDLRGEMDVLLCEFGYYELARTAMRLSRELRVPWVADLQDPWALDEMWLYPSGLHRRVDARRMRHALTDAEAVIMNTREAANRVRERIAGLDPARVYVATGGFNAADFAEAMPDREDGSFRIVHTGTLHTELGLHERRKSRRRRVLGGAPIPGVDILTRSHFYLTQAVDRLVRRSPALDGVVEVHLVGPMTDTDRMVSAAFPWVRAHGFATHRESIRMIRGADLLFLPMHDLPEPQRAGLVPTKAYEYAASGRPILAAVPSGDVRELLGKLGNAVVVSPSDTSAMEDAIEREIARWRTGEVVTPPDPSVLAPYEYGNITKVVAEVLDGVSGTAQL